MTENPDLPPEAAMIGDSPSARGLPAIPDDSAQHAEQSCREWEDVCESYIQRRMRDLGIEEERIGAVDYSGDGQRHAFIPGGKLGGTCDDFGRLYVDSGFLNPGLLAHLGGEVDRAWRLLRRRYAVDCVIAHEDEETTGSHETAIERAADTKLPIADEARHVLRLIAEAEHRQRGR